MSEYQIPPEILKDLREQLQRESIEVKMPRRQVVEPTALEVINDLWNRGRADENKPKSV